MFKDKVQQLIKNMEKKNSKLSLRLILKFEQKYKHLDGYIEYAHLLLCQLILYNIDRVLYTANCQIKNVRRSLS